MYTGIFFGAKYVNHLYKPTKLITRHLLKNFVHKYKKGDWVKFREPHKRTEAGVIMDCAYSTQKRGGGTIKVYLLKNKWISEGCLRGFVNNKKYVIYSNTIQSRKKPGKSL